MAMDVSTLSVRVESKGIDTTTKSLEGLEKRAGTTEAAVMSLMDKLGKSSASVLSVVQSMNQLRATMQGALPNNAISASLSDFKKMADEIKNIQSMMGKGVGGNISVTIKDIGTGSKEAVKGVESLNQSLASGQNVLQMFGKELYHIRNLLGGTMLAGALINTAQAAIGMADSWVLMKAKLNIALGSMDSAVNMQEKLFKVATSLHVPLEGVTQLFVRLVPAMKDYGYTTNDALQVTTAMASALKVSGATAAEASSVMLQFSQSMQAGRLNGAEFNAVAEGAPIVLRAIAAETGKTRSELKQMGADGQLGIELITKAMVKWGPIWEQLVKDMPVTFEAAMGDLSTSMSRFIGITNESLGVTQTLSAGIEWLAKNLDTIAKIVGVGVVAAIAALTTSLAISAVTAAADAFAMVSLAAAIGGTGVASAGAAVAVEVLTGALATLNINPIVLAVTALVAAGAAIYAFATKTEKPLQAVYDNIDKINEAHPDSKGKFEAFTNEVAKLDKQITAGYKNYAALKEQQEKTFDPAEANKLTEQLKIQAKAIGDLEAAQKLYAQQIQNTGKIASDAHTKFMKENESQMQALGIEGNLKRRLTDSEKALLKTVKDLQEARALDPSSKRVQELNAEAIALGKRISEEKRVGDLIQENKAAKKSGESFEKKYQKETEGIQAFINKQNEELGLTRKLTEAEKESLKISEFISANRAKLSVSQLAALNVKRETILTNGLELKAQKDLLKVQTEAQDKYYKERSANLAAAEATRVATETLQRKIDLQSMTNAGITETALGEHLYTQAVNASALASINRAIATEQEAKALEQKKLAMAGSEGDQELARKAIKDLDARVESLNRQKSAIEEILPLQQKLTEELSIAAKKSMLDVGRSPGQILADGFGEAGLAISKMTDAYKSFGDETAKVDKYVADQKKMLMDKGPPNPSELAKLEKEVAGKRIQINAQMYGSLAGAAKGFFSENSKGYQAMAKAEKAFHAIELAMATKAAVEKMALMGEELATKLFGITTATAATQASVPIVAAAEGEMAAAAAPAAVLNAAQMPGPLAFAGAAAMIALIAALGVSMSGGGATPDFKAERQASAGTGSVFGDTGAKSESISKALENISANSEIANQYNNGMLNALKNIESSLTSLAKITIRSGAQAAVRNISGMGTTHNSTTGKIFDPGHILFSVKKSLVDSGLLQQAQTLSEIMQGGTNITGYATVETKSKRWGKTKTSTEEELTKLDDNLQKQFTDVIKGMASAITESAKVLNLDTAEFTNTLNSFVVDIGHISLHDLSREQIQEQFAAVFSKMGDDMAKSALPMLEKYQNAGEGYLETLMRVTSAVATVDGIFKTVGTTFGQVGLAGVEAKMHLVDLAGGLDKLSGLVSGFFEKFYTDAEQKATLAANVSQKLISLGITGLDVTAKDGREAFRRVVEQYKDTNSEVFIELLKLSDSVDKLAPAFEDANKAAEDAKAVADNLEKIAQQKLNLDIEMFNLQGNSLEAIRLKRESEIKTIDTSLVALQQLIWKIGDLKAGAHTAMTSLEKSVTAEKTALKKSLDIKVKAVEDLKVVENSRYEAERKTIQDNVDAQNAAIESHNAEIELANKAKEITNDSLRAQIDSIKETRNNLKGLFDSIGESIRSIIGSTDTLQSISYETAKKQLDVALATRSVYDTEQFKTTLSTLSGASGAGFGSSFEFNKEKLVTAGKLFDLQSIVGSQIAAQDATVVAIEASIKANVDAIEANKVSEKISADEALKAAEGQHILNISKLDEQIKVLNLQYTSDIEYLDNILVEARKQLDMADGIYMETKGVKDAVNTFATALTGYITAKDAQTVAWVNQISAMAFSTIPTLTAIAERTSTENQQLKDEVVGLREDAAAQSKAIAISSAKTAKVLTQWDGDGQPETRVV